MGFYILGSIALDGFHEDFSDIDFVAVLTHRASREEFEKLRNIHRRAEKKLPRPRLSGGYFLVKDLGQLQGNGGPYLSFHDGKLRIQEKLEANPITWWEPKNRGIAIVGDEPQKLNFTVDWDLLIDWMMGNMNSYWVGWTRRPGRFFLMLSDWGIQWTVLGVLRQCYTLRENEITTKTKAAEYALTCLPSHWHSMIQEAIYIREGKKRSFYWSRIAIGIKKKN